MKPFFSFIVIVEGQIETGIGKAYPKNGIEDKKELKFIGLKFISSFSY